MTILIAPDKFKGSLTAEQVCTAIEKGIRDVSDSLKIVSVPLADGGEGTADLLTRFSGGTTITVEAVDPLWRPIKATYGVSSDRSTAFIEMAKVSGLQLLKIDERNPLVTTTFGTGQLIKDALSRGVSHIVLGIGGSATNDAGCGMAAALGFSFLDSNGQPLKAVGGNLIDIHSITPGNISLIRQAKFTVLCDVDNPLYGETGAAFVFAPQKGANSSTVRTLDNGLRKFEEVVQREMNLETNFPGAGAAGGMGAGARTFLRATLTSGFDFISGFTRLEEHVRAADLVITGEGKIDTQTLSGKVIKGVATLAANYGKRCIAIAGACDLDPSILHQLQLSEVITLVDPSISPEEAIRSASAILEKKSAELIRRWISTF